MDGHGQNYIPSPLGGGGDQNRDNFNHLFLPCLQFFKVKVGLTSAWTREFLISFCTFCQWYAVINIGSTTEEGLQKKDLGISITSSMQQNKNRLLSLVFWFRIYQ